VLFGGDGGERELGEGFGDSDGRASVGFELGGVDLFADRDEVGGELFGGFWGEAGCTAAGFWLALGKREQWERVRTICSS
jgi:hypothetical protein